MFRGVRHLRRIVPAAVLAVWLGGCASLGIADPDNQPINGNAEQAFASSRTDPNAGDDVLVGLAFSGGGTRAAAFAHGVLLEIDQTTVRTRTGTHSLLDIADHAHLPFTAVCSTAQKLQQHGLLLFY